jgi:hypothetical protein
LSQHRSPHRTHTPDGPVCTGLTPRELCKRSLHRTPTRTRPSSHRTQTQRVSPRNELTGRGTPDSTRKLFPRPVPQLGRVRPHTGRVRPESLREKFLNFYPCFHVPTPKCHNTCASVLAFSQIFLSRIQVSTLLDPNAYAQDMDLVALDSRDDRDFPS